MDNVLSEIDGLQEVDSDVVEDDDSSSSEEDAQWSYVDVSPTAGLTKVSTGHTGHVHSREVRRGLRAFSDRVGLVRREVGSGVVRETWRRSWGCGIIQRG